MPGLDGVDPLGHGFTSDGLEADLILNGLLSIALGKLAKIEAALGKDSNALILRDSLNNAINNTFYDADRDVYKIRASSPATCKLGCAIAILSGAAEEHKETIAEKLTGTDLPDASLSMQCFVCSLKSENVHLNEHESSAWLKKNTLNSVQWLPADRALLPKIAELL